MEAFVRVTEAHFRWPEFAFDLAGAAHVRLVFPQPSLLVELAIFMSLAFAISAMHAALMVAGMRPGEASVPVPSRFLGTLAVVLGALALPLPFVLPAQHGMPRMGLALVLWVSYWKVLDLVGGTARPAVRKSPFTLLVHLLVMLDFRGDDHTNEAPKRGELTERLLAVLRVVGSFVLLASAVRATPPAALSQSALGAAGLCAL